MNDNNVEVYKETKGGNKLPELKSTKVSPELMKFINNIASDEKKEVFINYLNKLPDIQKAPIEIDEHNASVMIETIKSEGKYDEQLLEESKIVVETISEQIKKMNPDDSNAVELARIMNDRVDKDQAYGEKKKNHNFNLNSLKQYGGYALMVVGTLGLGLLIKEEAPELFKSLFKNNNNKI